jgi:glycosyltransferase involved in cell wall biosynthesis
MDCISVVIPLYNKAQYISRAISSVLAQTELLEEIIVIDDGSTDGGGELVEQFKDSRIRLLRQENKGVSSARNLGISVARGDLIAFLDADDEWKPRFLEVIRNMREAYPQAGAYATAYDWIMPEGRRKNLRFKVLPSHCEQALIDNFFKDGIPPPIWTSAVVIPKIVFNQIGGFPEGEHIGQDVDMWIRVGIRYPIAWNSTILATYRMDATNRTYRVKKYNYEPVFSRTVNEAIQSGIVPATKLPDLREYTAHWQYSAACHCILNGKGKIAVKIINQTKGTHKFRRQGWILLMLAYLPPILLTITIKIYKGYLRIIKNISDIACLSGK